MNILWMYDQPITPERGGTERATCLISKGLKQFNHTTIGFLMIDQDTRKIFFNQDTEVVDLYSFLVEKQIDIVVNQIGFSSWLLVEFLNKGGKQWRNEGGRIITIMHFDPVFPRNTAHNLLLDWHQLPFYRKLKRMIRIILLPRENYRTFLYHKKAYQLLYRLSDRYILLSAMHIPSFKKITELSDVSKISAIPNVLTFDDISTLEELQQKEPIALIVSRLDEPQKRISISLKCWKQIQNLPQTAGWKLQIIGDGNDVDYYRRYIKKNNLQRVEMLGKQNPDEYYKTASIFLMTSSAEGWGLTLTESLERGVVPITMNSSPSFADILKGDLDNLVKNNDIEAFKHRILEMMSNEQLRRSKAEAALQRVKRFSSERICSIWSVLINEVCEK